MKIKNGMFLIPATHKDSIRELMKRSGLKDEKVVKLIYRFSEITSVLAKELTRSKSKSAALSSLKEMILLECPEYDLQKDYLLVIRNKKKLRSK